METRSGKLRSRRSIHSEEVESKLKHNLYIKELEDIIPECNTADEFILEKDKVEEADKNRKLNEGDRNKLKDILYILALVPIIFFLIYPLTIYAFGYDTKEDIESFLDIDIQKLKILFPQEEDFWLNIQVAVEEVINLKQPKSIIFLYKPEQPIEQILLNISEYATSKILPNKQNENKPIVVNSDDLSRQDILEDYGVFITDIKEKLQNSSVVIVKNLDKIPGKAAQAFHSLCDEYNPIQEKVLYLFTIRGDNFPGKLHNFVENKLRKNWIDIHSDKFYPLITRMTTFILKVK